MAARYAVPGLCGEASIKLMRLNSGKPGGVIFSHFFPPSRVM